MAWKRCFFSHWSTKVLTLKVLPAPGKPVSITNVGLCCVLGEASQDASRSFAPAAAAVVSTPARTLHNRAGIANNHKEIYLAVYRIDSAALHRVAISIAWQASDKAPANNLPRRKKSSVGTHQTHSAGEARSSSSAGSTGWSNPCSAAFAQVSSGALRPASEGCSTCPRRRCCPLAALH